MFSYVFGLACRYNETKMRKSGNVSNFKMTALNHRREVFSCRLVFPSHKKQSTLVADTARPPNNADINLGKDTGTVKYSE